MKKNILVLCTGNSCRSQMAEGYLRYFASRLLSGDKVNIYSAGIEAQGVNPKAIRVMKEDGIDISNHTSKTIDELLNSPSFPGKNRREAFDFVVTVCDNAKENCPYFPAKAKKFHHNFPDPAKASGSEDEILNKFISVRDEIKEFSKNFISELF